MLTNKGEKTRQHFIRTSAELFNKKGYAGTAISDILEASGYSKGALYRTFESKDVLSVEAFKHNMNTLKTAIEGAISREKTPKEKLLALPRFYQQNKIGKLLPGGCPLLNTALEMDDTNAEMNQMVRKGFDFFQAKIRKILTAGKQSGAFSPDLDIEKTAIFILATIEGAVAMSKSYHSGSYMQQAMAELERYLETTL